MGLVYQYGACGGTKLRCKGSLPVSPEDEEVEKICSTLKSIQMWWGCSVKIGYDIATPEQVSMGDWLWWVGREIISGEDANMQPYRSMQEPQYNMSYSSVASQLLRKTPKFSVFSGDSTQKGEIAFKTMGVQGQKCHAKSHRGNPEGGG